MAGVFPPIEEKFIDGFQPLVASDPPMRLIYNQ
jgi:hypothetical protein